MRYLLQRIQQISQVFRVLSRHRGRILPALLRALLLLYYCDSAVAQEAVPVTVVNPEFASVVDRLSLSGSLEAKQRSALSPRVNGLVAKVLVDAGDRVQINDLLLQLDDEIARLTLNEASAAHREADAVLGEARRQYDEALRLHGQNHISASELATRKSELARAEAARGVALAREKAAAELVSRHRLPAPFAGIITDKMTEAGEWVDRGDPVLELVALTPVYLDVMAPQERFAEITAATPVVVLPDAAPGARLQGRIEALVPVGDRSARAFLVRVMVDDVNISLPTDNSLLPGNPLLPGTSATAIFTLNHSERQELIVPRDALLRQPDGGYSLFVIENNQAQRRPVQVGREGSAGVVILQGLEPNQPVVIRGNETLRSGQPVRIVSGP